VRIAQERRQILRIENHKVRSALEELRAFQEVRVGKPVEILKCRIAKHLHSLADHLVGQNQSMTPIQNFM
jgi:hypothetical protein